MDSPATPHRQMLANPTTEPLTSAEISAKKAARDFERSQWDHDRRKEEAVRHRMAPAHSGDRLSSWAAEKSPSQLAFEASRRGGASRPQGVSEKERIANERANFAHGKKLKAFDRHKELDVKVKKAQRGFSHEVNHSSGSKRVASRDWEDAIRQNRTEARKQELTKSVVIPAQKCGAIEHDETHVAYGHLTPAELADYGMIEGETLDDEGRVVPPWVGRAERYAGPEGEDQVRYPYDFGYGARGFFEKSRGKMPPPQLYIKDKKTKPRRDPDLYDPVAPYVPFGGNPAEVRVHPAFGRPEQASALAYERAAYGYGYGYGHPMHSHPVYGPVVQY